MVARKVRSAFVCGECGSEHAKWQGQCNACEAWNTLSRVNIGPIAEPVRGFAGAASEVKRLADVKAEGVERIATGLGELDRVLGGGLVPGYSNQRALELLVDAGFTSLEAIRIGTLNGANYIGRGDKTGSLAVGKLADFIVLNGNPAAQISDVRNVELVFRQGVGFDPVALIESVRGKVGLY